ncbi:hypothetical protein [Microbacterium sp. dk485]|uniref:hypothetical protein n=1 Tax=Microbacterium sp. dk485 TaxID=2560021 RepID=UPI001FD77A5B|nr:hypothetical protein [Microbacterium sp. dk485]
MTDPELDDTTIARAPAREDAVAADGPGAEATTTEASAADAPPAQADDSRGADQENPPQYGVGPFTIREVALTGVWLVAFVISFFPLNIAGGNARPLFGGDNVWVSGLSWILAIGLPTVAVFLLVLRRLSPQGIRRVGSLGIDQFASVAFSVAALVWLTWLWDTIAIAIETDFWTRSWVVWVEVVLMLAGVALTVFAPIIPVLEQDFQGRPEAPAHRNARPVRAVTPRPVRERPARQQTAHAPVPAPVDGTAFGGGPQHAYDPAAAPTTSYDAPQPAAAHDTAGDAAAQPAAAQQDTGSYDTDVFAPLRDEQAPAATGTQTQEWTATDDTVASASHSAPAQQQAFWALVPVERDVVDEYGAPLFRIGPTAWALVLEDRGEVFVVRHEDGRIGYLHDVSGVTRG